MSFVTKNGETMSFTGFLEAYKLGKSSWNKMPQPTEPKEGLQNGVKQCEYASPNCDSNNSDPLMPLNRFEKLRVESNGPHNTDIDKPESPEGNYGSKRMFDGNDDENESDTESSPCISPISNHCNSNRFVVNPKDVFQDPFEESHEKLKDEQKLSEADNDFISLIYKDFPWSTARSQKTSNEEVIPMSWPANLPNQSRKGFTGLENLGNTCFMNVVIQCLSNTQELRDYFADDHFKEDINEKNPLGSGGHLAISFAVLLRHLWSGKHSYYSPAKLKSLLSEKFSQFSGFAQHDAQEYMSVLLDVLHEDINRIRQKPYVELNSKDGDDDLSIPDEDLADDTWHKFRMRNDSIIVDLFYGQYKSRVACPVCPKVSITFDPFLSLPVPLPRAQIFHTVFFFARDASRKPVRHLVRLPQESKVGNLLLAVSAKTGVEVSNLRTLLVKEGTIQSILKPHHIVPVVSDNEMILM